MVPPERRRGREKANQTKQAQRMVLAGRARVVKHLSDPYRTLALMAATLHAGPVACQMLVGFALVTDAKSDTAVNVRVVRVRELCPAIQHWTAPSSIAHCAGLYGAFRQCPDSVGRTCASHALPRARRL